MKKTLAAWLAALPALAAAQGMAWVSSEKDGAITMLDLARQEVAGTVATCKRPRHMMLSTDRKQLLVACSDSSQLDVIDLATKKSVRRIPFGEDPEVFDLSPDGKTAYVGLEDEGQLAWVDMATGKTTRTVEVGKEPEGVLTSKDGKTVWVTSEVANMVHAVDVASGKVTNIKVGKRPRRFALTPDGSQLWVTNELGASVSIIDPKTNQVTATVEFQVPGARSTDITPVGITMTKDGKRAFVALGKANHVAFVDVATRKTEKLVLVGKRVWHVALDAAEAKLYAVNGLSDDLTIIDVAGAKALKTVKVGRVPYMSVIVE